MSSLTATEEHPEKIEPTLPVHATPPVVEPGEPVSRRMIAEAAYYRAEKRGFAHGMALDAGSRPRRRSTRSRVPRFDMKGRTTRRIIGAGAIVAGALFMWLSPEQALLGVLLMAAGIALEIIGIALERR